LVKFVFYIHLSLVITLPYFSYGQQISYNKTPAVSIHLEMSNFKKTDSSSGKATQPGLAVSYQNNISSYIVYNAALSGAFIEQAQKNDGKKDLFLEGDLSLRANCFKQDKIFNPYVQAGIGISKYKNDYNFILPAGIGCQVNLTRDVFLLINTQYRFAISDKQFNHWVNSIGIAGVINRKKIIKLKQVPLPVAAATINPVDTDGDGILDGEDSCKLVVGVIKYHGCPPPDQDHGDISSEIKQQINIAATKIFFETGSFNLLQQSYGPLNEVVHILIDNPRIQLLIEGHTDNVGTPASNQLLSENRARTVFAFLTSAGISVNRLQYRGFGQEKPIADNSSSEGRSKNRRVELKLL
jgi:OOP family OmpA-OmpF porin